MMADMAQPLDPRVEIGRVRLHVADLDRAVAFYTGVLGFDVTQRVGTAAAYLGAGGFHHHIALSASNGARGPGDLPSRFSIRFPDRVALANALRRLDESNVVPLRSEDDGVSEGLFVRDPDGNEIELYFDRPRAEQASGPAGTDGASKDVDLAGLRAAASPVVEGHASAAPVALSDATRERLRDLRARLLHLHKVLLDDTKTAYELDRGRVGSNANLLQLVISDPWFAWLHSLSEMIVRIDETVEQDAPATPSDATLLIEQVERLLTASEAGDGFARRYYEALQRQPAVVLAHADVRRTLKSMH
jgi:catechol 2,3-dioxygenase